MTVPLLSLSRYVNMVLINIINIQEQPDNLKKECAKMGAYLNSKNPFGLFSDEASGTYFVDKSSILDELIPLASANNNTIQPGEYAKGRSNKFICITRPRRFGKTVAASMIASFFSKGINSRDLFRNLKIGQSVNFESHINKHNVIYISFNEIPQNCTTYQK